MKKTIETMLFMIYREIGIDNPENHIEILEFCYLDVKECADIDHWHDGDVSIAFRRYLESKGGAK
jgi:hypothetical protein